MNRVQDRKENMRLVIKFLLVYIADDYFKFFFIEELDKFHHM